MLSTLCTKKDILICVLFQKPQWHWYFVLKTSYFSGGSYWPQLTVVDVVITLFGLNMKKINKHLTHILQQQV